MSDIEFRLDDTVDVEEHPVILDMIKLETKVKEAMDDHSLNRDATTHLIDILKELALMLRDYTSVIKADASIGFTQWCDGRTGESLEGETIESVYLSYGVYCMEHYLTMLSKGVFSGHVRDKYGLVSKVVNREGKSVRIYVKA